MVELCPDIDCYTQVFALSAKSLSKSSLYHVLILLTLKMYKSCTYDYNTTFKHVVISCCYGAVVDLPTCQRSLRRSIVISYTNDLASHWAASRGGWVITDLL